MKDTYPGREPHPPTTQPPHPADPRPATGPAEPPTPPQISAKPTAGTADALPGDPPVPVTIWHVTDLHNRGAHHTDTITAETARPVVAYYTSGPGDAIVSLGHEPALAGAAGAAGCTYVAVNSPADLADLDHVAGTVRLLVLRWPPQHRQLPPAKTATAELTDLFAACRLLLAHNGYTIVAVIPGDAATDYTAHVRLVVPAARRAGLGWLRHIVAVTPAAATQPAACAFYETTTPAGVDLLVFSIGDNPRGERPPTAKAVRDRQDATAASPHLHHTTGTNQFFVDLIVHSRTHAGCSWRRGKLPQLRSRRRRRPG
ncbi:replication-relaxation family protein [Polymorphospora sp. NPDC051019]|uniref:replication-relaxation family protein n=1 Tax=Polymorphospora sp. NPDC051019 TaxID=3155725 RepID=UPI00344513AF